MSDGLEVEGCAGDWWEEGEEGDEEGGIERDCMRVYHGLVEMCGCLKSVWEKVS